MKPHYYLLNLSVDILVEGVETQLRENNLRSGDGGGGKYEWRGTGGAN